MYIFQGNALDDTLPPSYPAVSGTLRQCTNGTDAEIDSSELLEAMRLWSKDHAQSSDKRTIWHLLSGCFDFVNSVAGKAYVKVACTQADGRNVGYSSRLTAALTWLVVAHEVSRAPVLRLPDVVSRRFCGANCGRCAPRCTRHVARPACRQSVLIVPPPLALPRCLHRPCA